MNDIDLEGKSYLVTAANSGIGRVIVDMLLGSGAHVIATTRKGKRIGVESARLTHLEVDLLATDDCQEIGSTLENSTEFSGIVHVAGAWVPGDLFELSSEEFERAFFINVTTAFNICRVCLPFLRLRNSGSIVTIGSMIGLSPVPKSIAYSSSKAALIQFTRSLALDEGKNGIRCNCICPGLVNTLQTENVFQNDEWVALLTRSYPLGRLGKPSDIAGVVRFLLSDAASWMTGLAIPVEGGYLLSAESPRDT